jgi:hypothetical protein
MNDVVFVFHAAKLQFFEIVYSDSSISARFLYVCIVNMSEI